jgi:CRISPR/Cas system-associated protein Cas10 (large subunit of type III CRISPR-Cas system)
MTQKSHQYNISLSDCLEDIASNFIYAESEYSDVPPFVLIPLMFDAINDLIDEFSSNPEKYISKALRQKIDEVVAEYLATAEVF